jgi:hypothetical protein
LLVDTSIELENLQNFLPSQFFSQVCGMSLLPQEFSCSQERSCLLGLPPNDTVPLVESERKISVTSNPL